MFSNQRHRLTVLVACIGLCGGVGNLSPRRARADQTDLAKLVEQLDAARYDERTEATETLIQRGAEAIGPLESAFGQGSLELRTRVIYILKEVALAKPGEIDGQAVEALQRIAASQNPSAGRAQKVLAQLADIGEQRALARLLSLGAKFERLRNPAFVPYEALVIDSGVWKGSEADLILLSHLRKVRAVQVSGDGVRDPWLEPIARMPNLTHLVIKRARHVTNAALLPLVGLRSLQRLDVFYSSIDDGAVDSILAMKNRLQYVRLYGTGISLEAARALEAALPPTAVLDYKRGAFLGVQCRSGWLCQVSEVTEGSAADRAGIQSSDILIRFGKKPIRSFEDLRDAIAANAPGDREKLTLLRHATEATFYFPRGSHGPKDVGFEAEQHVLGLLVTDVTKGSVADRAGLEKGDILFSVGGAPPKSIEHLLATLKKIDADRAAGGGGLAPRGGFGRPGNPPPAVSGLRGYRQVTVEVVFGEWQ